MKRWGITFLIILLNFVLQTTVFQHIKVAGAMPNTMILLIVSIALLRGPVEGAVVGFCCGLLQDIFFGIAMGFYALLGMIIGLLAGFFIRTFYRENYILPFILSISATFIYETIQFVFFKLFRGNADFLYFLQYKIIPQVVYTTLFVFVVYNLIARIDGALEPKVKPRKRYL